MSTVQIIATIMIFLVPLPASAQLVGQTLPDINFSDNIVTQAEIDMAEKEFSTPGLLPDSPFYFLKRFVEGIKLFFTFGTAEKARLHLDFAETRLAEAKKLIEKNQTKNAEGAINEYNKELGNFESSSRGIGKNVSALVKESSDVLDKSSLVLGLILEKAPEQARPALEKALNNSIEKKAMLSDAEIRKEIQRNREIRWQIKRLLEPVICIQVITPARSPEGECKEFPTPCDVPEGWEKVDSCGQESGLSGLATIAETE